MANPTYIEGTITLDNDEKVSFSITPGLGSQQWGNTTEVLGSTVELVESMTYAACDQIETEEWL